MLFMSIYTWKPENRDAVVARRMEIVSAPEGVKRINQWSDVSSGRVITLFEADNSLALVAYSRAWSDLGKFEIFPVVETEEVLKAIAASQKK